MNVVILFRCYLVNSEKKKKKKKITNEKIKAAVRNFFVFKIGKLYIICEYTMNPFSNPCFWLVLNQYATPIISVYILTILDWFG